MNSICTPPHSLLINHLISWMQRRTFVFHILNSFKKNTFLGGNQWFERRQLHLGSCRRPRDCKGGDWAQSNRCCVDVYLIISNCRVKWFFRTAWTHKVFYNVVLHFPPRYIWRSLSRLCGEDEGCYSPECSFDKKPTVNMQGHTNRESYNRKHSWWPKGFINP